MSDPYLYTVTNNVATFSINDAPWNLMSIEYIDRLEEQLPDVLADENIRAMIFTGEGLDNFSAGMNLKQIRGGVLRAGSSEEFFGQRHRVLDMIENGGTPAIATLFGFCLGGGLELPLACHFRIAADTDAQIGLPERVKPHTATGTSTDSTAHANDSFSVKSVTIDVVDHL